MFDIFEVYATPRDPYTGNKLQKVRLKLFSTEASAKKFNVRNSGSVTFKRAGANHNTTGYSTKRMRHLREEGQLSNSDSKRLKRIIDTLK